MNRDQEFCGQHQAYREKGEERIFEEMVRNFQNQMKYLNLDVQEAEQVE